MSSSCGRKDISGVFELHDHTSAADPGRRRQQPDRGDHARHGVYFIGKGIFVWLSLNTQVEVARSLRSLAGKERIDSGS
jgi:hypothetical protein